MASAALYALLVGSSVSILKQVNEIVTEPYMDEPFHVPQAQAYCRGDYTVWDPKITTPPGMYVMSVILAKLFVVNCTLPMLRLTSHLSFLGLPFILTHLLGFYERRRTTFSAFAPNAAATVIACCPIAWFFSFLYYTEGPSLILVLGTIIAATKEKHWLAALLGALSCTFRQTNIVWALYALGVSMLMKFKHLRETEKKILYDPSTLKVSHGDILKLVKSIPRTIQAIWTHFVPYAFLLTGFAAFIIWNGGIVLGDKSNHIPAFHVPQLYYFIGFATAIGWPVFLSTPLGVFQMLRNALHSMFGTKRNIALTIAIWSIMAFTINQFTIHHPFILSDNRHYTFYIWRRVFLLHPIMPYSLIPLYHACACAWFWRTAPDQTLLQALLLPLLVLPTLLPTPLLEPRYFLIPYMLLRVQASVDGTTNARINFALAIEGIWYMLVNMVTMWIFLYHERPGVGRFMW